MIQKFGHFCNPNLPLWLRVNLTMKQMPVSSLMNNYKKRQTAYHNLCQHLTPPPGTSSLLWLGLKFCIEKPLPKPKLSTHIERLTYDIRVRHTFASQKLELEPDPDDHPFPTDSDTEYDPKLYIKSSTFEPDPAPEPIEEAITQFQSGLQQLINTNQQPRRSNIPTTTRQALRQLRKDDRFIVVPSDKNLGPAVMERSTYITRSLKDHLLDPNTYKRLLPEEATVAIETSVTAMKTLLQEHWDSLTEHEQTYFNRCFKLDHRTPQFYTTPKVHKSPWKTRPIVSTVNSIMGYLSKWVDRQLQKVVHLCPAYLKDSKSLLDDLSSLDNLPPTAFFVIADAVSMYTNIDTQHSITSLREWLTRHKSELPHQFPTAMVIAAMELVMTSNIFQFDDTFWHQQTGTAMGTNTACMQASIYYANHEEKTLLQKYQGFNINGNNSILIPAPLHFYRRLIDDTLQIWDLAKLPVGMTIHNFCPQLASAMKYGILEWEVDKPAREVNFLDLTLTIQPDGSLASRSFIKPLNLQLYIPPQSAHSPGVLKSIIYGNVLRFWKQNTHQDNYTATVKDFYQALLNRGYRSTVLTPIFQSAAQKIDQQARKLTATATLGKKLPQKPKQQEKQLFLHWEFHPRDIARRDIRAVYKSTLEPVISQAPLEVKHFTIAYSNGMSLRRSLTKTQLEEPEGKRASNYIEQLD